MKTDHIHQKRLPFPADKDSAAFQREVILALIKEVEARGMKDIPVSNRYVFQHGRKWDFRQQTKEGYRPQSGQLELTSSTATIDLPRVLANEVTLKAGNITRADADGATAYLYMRSLGPPDRQPKNWRPANPSTFLAVLLLFGTKFKLQASWDLRALDNRSSGFFVPSNYLEFDRQVIEHGMNFTSRIGHGVWNVSDFEREFERAMQTSFSSATSDLSKECVILCTASSLLFPDRLPLLLEQTLI